MKTKVETITPEYAAEVLDKHNPVNRRISESTVQSYALDMKNGKWVITHQGIAFNTEGNLIDGQHRLWAVVFANKPIEFTVTRDVPVTSIVAGKELFTMDAIDRVRVRSTGQQMQLSHGIKNGPVIAATLRGVSGICCPNYGAKRLSTATSLFLYDLYGKNAEAILAAVTSPFQKVSYIMSPLTMYHKGQPEKAIEFARQLSTLEGLSPQVTTLRKYFDSHPNTKSDVKARATARCILAFHREERLSVVKDGNEGTDFLRGMFPSITKKITEAVTPIKMVIKKKGLSRFN